MHNLHLLLDHEHLPTERVEYDMEEVEYIPFVCGLGANWTGAPIGDWMPDDVGLFGVFSGVRSIACFDLEKEY